MNLNFRLVFAETVTYNYSAGIEALHCHLSMQASYIVCDDTLIMFVQCMVYNMHDEHKNLRD